MTDKKIKNVRSDCPDIGAKTDCMLCPGDTKVECIQKHKPIRCTITCAEYGCTTPIFYMSDDEEVPLYCEEHRTEYGRHAQVRVLKQPEKIPTVAREVVMLCPRCKMRKVVMEDVWKSGAMIRCLCGAGMLYHKDVKHE